MVYFMEDPIKMDDLGGFPPIFGNTHIFLILLDETGVSKPAKPEKNGRTFHHRAVRRLQVGPLKFITARWASRRQPDG